MKRFILGLVCLAMLSGVSFAKEKALLKSISLPSGATAIFWKIMRFEIDYVNDVVTEVKYGYYSESDYLAGKEPIANRIIVGVVPYSEIENKADDVVKKIQDWEKATDIPENEFYGATNSDCAYIPY